MLDFHELRDFGGGLVLGFRMAHAGSPADGSLVAIDEQVENGEVAQREIGDHGVEPRHDFGMARHGRCERAPSGESLRFLKVALSA